MLIIVGKNIPLYIDISTFFFVWVSVLKVDNARDQQLNYIA